MDIIGESDESTISTLISTNSAKLGEKIGILERFSHELTSSPFNLASYAHNSPSAGQASKQAIFYWVERFALLYLMEELKLSKRPKSFPLN